MTHLADLDFEPSPLNGGQVIHGRVHEEPVRHKVAIVGGAPGRSEAPTDDPEWSVWACNLIAPWDSMRRLRADRWFDIHQRCAQSSDDLRWIHRCPVPIYVPDDLLDAGPNTVRFPVERLEQLFGGYWACTFAYQMALALYEDYREIGLYGVDLAFGTERERTFEWACVSWWIGFAEGRGVTLHMPERALLGRHYARYGLEYESEKQAVENHLRDLAKRPMRHL